MNHKNGVLIQFQEIATQVLVYAALTYLAMICEAEILHIIRKGHCHGDYSLMYHNKMNGLCYTLVKVVSTPHFS